MSRRPSMAQRLSEAHDHVTRRRKAVALVKHARIAPPDHGQPGGPDDPIHLLRRIARPTDFSDADAIRRTVADFLARRDVSRI